MTDPPELTDLELDSERGLRARLRLEPDHPVFQGHFPGHAVLPGVAQIHWAARTAQRHLGCRGDFSGLESLKFLRLIVPPAGISLELDWEANTGLLSFRYTRDTDRKLCSSGRLRFII